MVLSLTYSPSLQESMAALADSISKLEAVMAKFLAISIPNASHFDTHVTTQTPSRLPPPPLDPTHEAPQITHKIAIFNIATIKPPTRLDNLSNKSLAPLLQSLTAKVDIQANGNPEHGFRCQEICYHGHQCHPPMFVFLQTEPEPPWNLTTINTTTTYHATNFTNIDTTSQQLPIQNKQLSSLVSGMPETELNNTENLPPLPPPRTTSLQIHPAQINLPTFGLAKVTENKTNYLLSPTKSSPEITCLYILEDMFTIFCHMKSFHLPHKCHPPKFVFLESKHEPPWKLFTLDYGNLGLEDKAVFQDGSIDT